jgi:myosin V
MNNSLDPKDPDNTGVRAALKMANVDEAQQAGIWKVLVGLLQMGNLTFKSKGSDGSEVKEKDEVAVIEKYLGIEALGDNLCIFRRIIQNKPLDSTVGPVDAKANRDALIKDIYGRIFDWLIHHVCNKVLKPEGDDDGFVGLLDIFGFEVFKRNSIEQLCINFANEKLQKLFNDHIFEEERKTYVVVEVLRVVEV